MKRKNTRTITRWSGLAGVVLAAVCLVPAVSAYAFSGSGSGMAGDPYIITTCAQLQEMNNDPTASYELGNDISCSGTFTPIGGGMYALPAFTGTFNGDYHTISGLTLSESGGSDFGGLFGQTSGNVTIENVGLVNVNAAMDAGSADDNILGALVGELGSGGVVTDSYVTGAMSCTIETGGLYEGSLVGINDGTVTDSYADTDYTACSGGLGWYSIDEGGLVGSNDGVIENSFSTGNTLNLTGDGGGTIANSSANSDLSTYYGSTNAIYSGWNKSLWLFSADALPILQQPAGGNAGNTDPSNTNTTDPAATTDAANSPAGVKTPDTGYGAPAVSNPLTMILVAGAVVSAGTGLTLLYRRKKTSPTNSLN